MNTILTIAAWRVTLFWKIRRLRKAFIFSNFKNTSGRRIERKSINRAFIFPLLVYAGNVKGSGT